MDGDSDASSLPVIESQGVNSLETAIDSSTLLAVDLNLSSSDSDSEQYHKPRFCVGAEKATDMVQDLVPSGISYPDQEEDQEMIVLSEDETTVNKRKW